MTNWYASLADLKARVGIADTLDDAVLKSVLESISREIDQWTGRRFYVETRTRTYRARRSGYLVVDDLLSVTSLKTAVSGRDYTQVWATTDYDLYPYNAPYESPPQPYWQILTVPEGNYRFPSRLARGVEIVGKWGYYEVLETSTTTLGAAVATTTTTSITTSASPDLEVGQTLLIDSEQVFLSALSGTTGTVVRGVNGTTAATHLNNAPIQVYTYPIVNEAAILQANHLFTSSRIAGGVLGGEGFGAVRIPALNPLVMSMLNPFRKVTVA